LQGEELCLLFTPSERRGVAKHERRLLSSFSLLLWKGAERRTRRSLWESSGGKQLLLSFLQRRGAQVKKFNYKMFCFFAYHHQITFFFLEVSGLKKKQV